MECAKIIIVLAAIVLMVYMLIREYLRPGLVLFSTVVLLLCCGIITTEDALSGFANKGMITVALLFLVSEGVRRSDCLGPIMKRIFPAGSSSIRRGYSTILTTVAATSAFLNNTPIVVIFIPHIKAWCRRVGLPIKKFLIPLSYAAILGGMCTLIGTSTNLVVHSLMLDAGLEGLSMFEIGKVGIIVAIVGLGYIILCGDRLLPSDRDTTEQPNNHIVEVVLAARFPGIRCSQAEFDFQKHYGATIVAIRRDGEIVDDMEQYTYKENDTLVLNAESSFMDTWGESRVFLAMTNGSEHKVQVTRWKRRLSLILLATMIVGATLSDMFIWAAVVAVIMACTNIFPAKKYTKFISWDILITIASAFAISRAMSVSGVADAVAELIIGICEDVSPYTILAVIYIVTNIITELITNNAAAAFAFPIALSVATKLGADPTPFCIAICIAASASFSTPIGYQTNTIVQGLGSYRFSDFVRFGLPLNIITFIVSMIFIPIFWSF